MNRKHAQLRAQPRVRMLEDRITPALVAAYAFSEGAGTSVGDSSGNGATGTISSATWSAAGRFGNALSFNGVNNLVTIADRNSLDLTNGMTLEAWVFPTAINGWETVVLKEATTDLAYALYADNNGNDAGGPRRPNVSIRQGATTYMANGTSQLPLNTWTHLAATYDGAVLRQYVGGVLAGSLNRTGTINVSTGALRIGGNNVWGEWFNGLIDEVRIYNTALTQAQIQTDMNAPVLLDTTPPAVTNVAPAAGANGVSQNASVTATFSENLNPTSINATSFTLRDSAGALVPGSVTFDGATRIATLDPTPSLALAMTYTATIVGGAAGVRDLSDNPLASDFAWTFTTTATLPLPTLSIGDVSLSEGNSGAVDALFNVTLSAASTQIVSVTYATENGTATAGSDYTSQPPTVLTFAPGELNKQVAVPVLGDTDFEANETFFVSLSAPLNATLADAQGVATIADDDIALIGVDGFGYAAYSHVVESLDLVPGATGVTTVRSAGDNNANSVTLAGGAVFRFYGVNYTTLRVSTNGLISFGSNVTAAANTNLTTSPTQAVIAVLWDDWVNTSGNAMVLTRYRDNNADGINDQLIIEWNNVQGSPSSPSPATFQAILQLNTGALAGDITFNYPDIDTGDSRANGGSASVGIKASGSQGSSRLLVSFNAASAFVGSGRAIRIRGDTSAPAVNLTSPAAGATVSGTVSVQALATDNVGVAGVQFLLDGVNLGAEDTTAPFGVNWATTAAANGSHTLVARARDVAGNMTTSTAVSVTVLNGAAQVGQWSSVMNWPLVAINTVLLKDGRVLMWDGGPACIGSTSARVWNPATGLFSPVPIPYFSGVDDDIFCSAQALLADGRVLVVGGHDCDGPQLGIRMVNIFDPVTMTWTRGPDMAYRRWYPTATTLSDGRVLVTAGSVNTTIDYVPIPEIYDPVTNSWTTLTAANRTIPNYPFVFQNPDGRVLATGSDEAPMATYALNVNTQTWSTVDSAVLDAGSAVMYRPGQVLKAGSSYLSPPPDNGGGIPSSANTYVLDATGATSPWQQTAAMAIPRTHLNLTVLPDGNVIATGGSTDIGGVNPANAVYPAEMWSPVTRTWTTLASMQTPRLYHSTALLMPDGRVLVAGGGHNYFNSIEYSNAEYYSPPYLFKGPRPAIAAAPDIVAYNSEFFVESPDAANVTSVALIRNGSVTHSFNMDQRFVPLSFSQSAGGLTVQAPADARIAPPGHYMLFIVNGDGVPSVAPIVRLPAPYEDVQPPTAPAGLMATGAVLRADLAWQASTDNVGVVRYDVHRSLTPDFAPSVANRIGQTTATSYTDAAPPGTYYYRAVAIDAVGNSSPSSNEATATIAADSTAPAISITSPTAGATVFGTITVSAAAFDAIGVTGVQFLLNGAPLGAESTSLPYSTTWNTAAFANGVYSLSATARDAAGNSATSLLIDVTVFNDTTAPSLELTNPVDGAQVSGAITVSANAADEVGVAGVTFLLDGISLGAEITAPSYSFLWDSSLASNGAHILTARARDAAGNTTTVAASITVANTDSVPPSIGLTGPADGATVAGSISVTAAAGDNVAVAGVQFLLDGVNLGSEDLSAPYSVLWNTLAAGNGVHTLAAIARDTAGNTTTSVPISVVVSNDILPPSVALTSPSAGASVTGNTTVAANAADGVGVAGVQFYLDGNALGAEDTTAPYSITWNTTTVANGAHTLTARARDAAGNQATSAPVAVTVSNSTGLIAAYGFEEGSGATARDQSGANLNGTISNATWTASGRFGNALSFNGTNALVTVANAAGLQLTSGMTLMAWVRPTAASTDFTTVILKERPSGLAYALYANDGAGRPPAGYINVGGTDRAAVGTSVLSQNTWTHLALTYNGSKLIVFVNGVQVGSRAQTGSMTTSTSPLRIGGNSVWGEYFTGLIDEVRVYNRALTAAQIQSDMTVPVGGGTGAQHVRGAAESNKIASEPLSADAVSAITPEVSNRWIGLGAPAALLRDQAWQIRITDLPGSNVGFTAENVVWLDRDAAGHGWYIDPTPADDSEFLGGVSRGPAMGRVDLLTVLAHEFGHILGMATTPNSDLMGDDLPLGVRRIFLNSPIGESQDEPETGSLGLDMPLSALSSASRSAFHALDFESFDGDENFLSSRWGIVLDRVRTIVRTWSRRS